jgi:hypothetical protein
VDYEGSRVELRARASRCGARESEIIEDVEKIKRMSSKWAVGKHETSVGGELGWMSSWCFRRGELVQDAWSAEGMVVTMMGRLTFADSGRHQVLGGGSNTGETQSWERRRILAVHKAREAVNGVLTRGGKAQGGKGTVLHRTEG